MKRFHKIGSLITLLWVIALLYLGITIMLQNHWWGLFIILAGIATGVMEYNEGTFKPLMPVPPISNGDYIKITYLPPCLNGHGNPNPYIGMEGIVHDFNGVSFNLCTETSWLVGIKIKTCKFVKN